MALTKEEAQGVARLFIRDYPSALELAYKFRDTTTELYGPRAKEVPQGMKGGYLPKETLHAGRVYRGRVEVPLANMTDARDLLLTLRHEVLGHYGINTFTPGEKRALLDGLIAAREEPSLKPLWADIDERYGDSSLDMRAEEVYALHCEGVAPSHHVGTDRPQRGKQAYHETCLAPVRLMCADDLQSIACMVAQGLHDRTRMQQNFPTSNELFRKKETDMEPKKPFHETVAEKLIEQLKEGTAPWQKPWQAGDPGAVIPINPTTGKRYRGINAIHLMSQGHTDQRWMTYKQASAVDAQVRKGERGTPIQYWKFSEEHDKLDASGKPVLDTKGEPIKQTVKLERPRVFFATVFNAEQIDGLPTIQARKQQDWNAVERAEQILQASGAVIRHGEQNRAFYRPATDSIHLPNKGQFPTADNYYATVLHELGHWTGHESRLDRDLVHPFGSDGYAKEELRAEIASMILGDELGIGHDPGQHVAYVGSWIKALEEDPLEIFRAASDAEKIQDYVLGLEQKQVQEQSTQQRQSEELNNTVTQVRSQAPTEEVDMHNKLILTRENWEKLEDAFGGIITKVKIFDSNEQLVAQTEERYQQRWLEPITKPAEMDTQTSPMEASTSDADAHINEHEKEANLARGESVSLGVKTFIEVPFNQKEEVKALGAKWDRQEKSWYVPTNIDAAPFAKWITGMATGDTDAPKSALTIQTPSDSNQKPAQKRQYLAVPYGEHIAAKAAGAMWDKAAKSWYAGPKADMPKLDRWDADRVPDQQWPAMTPEEEFAEALKSTGCVLDADPKMRHPIMDGAKHRIAVTGDKKGEQAGFYVGHLDGHPAGYIKNNKTGIEIKWKSKGYTLDPEQKAQMQAEAAAKSQAREAEQAKLQEQTSQRVVRQMSDLVVQPTGYMQAKGIQPQTGVMTDKEGQKTYIPATDANGKQWSMQYIQEDGTKRFAKDSRKEGCFHVVGGLDALVKAPAIVIGEGYATAGSLSQTLGFATVAAFDSGNLLHVAKALHEKFPDKPIIIAGDDDKHLETTQGVNPGRSKAEEAASAVGGKVLFPIFAPGEQTTNPKGFTDFNDLANKSELGREGIERQVNSIVDAVIEKHQARNTKEQERERISQREQLQRPRRTAKAV